jgi:hypothetical protein
MNATIILDELTHYRRLPVAAIEAARDARSTMAARFLRIIESLPDPREGDVEEQPPSIILIFHLLGEWREKSAYRPLVGLLHRPDVDELLGDAVTETGASVLAAVFDGDPQPLYDLILDQDADEFARSAVFDTLVTVVREGLLPRTQVEQFLVRCFSDLKPIETCFVWSGWQEAIALLGLAELRPLVKQVFDRGGIDRTWLSYEDFEEDLAYALDHPDAPHKPDPERHRLFGDTIKALSKWHGFSQRYFEDQRNYERSSARQLELYSAIEDPGSPFINPSRDVGRNDPCPCGSGEKYKKCCLH